LAKPGLAGNLAGKIHNKGKQLLNKHGKLKVLSAK
jgi:hypothetical protein